ncbi:MAG: rod shape-determining protein MreC [Candidatus Omnitrophica bacterium]|nr:rod shape-determining protein MreC [Candidatus Omnitrophota bacterium]
MLKLSRKTITSIAVIAFLIFLVSVFSSSFKNTSQRVFKPHLSLIDMIKRELGGIVFFHRNMVDSDRLRYEVGELRRKLFEMRETEQENLRLKGLFSFKKNSPFRMVCARVIARSPDSWSSSLIIDKGRNSGIRRGMAVVNASGLLGRIIESSEDTSKVLLINDPSQGVSAIVQRSRQEGLVSGSLGSNLIMRYLPNDAQIAPGDTIITSELSRVYPRGLLVGKVVSIGKEFSGLSRYAVIRPSADLSGIEEVLVIIP